MSFKRLLDDLVNTRQEKKNTVKALQKDIMELEYHIKEQIMDNGMLEYMSINWSKLEREIHQQRLDKID